MRGKAPSRSQHGMLTGRLRWPTSFSWESTPLCRMTNTLLAQQAALRFSWKYTVRGGKGSRNFLPYSAGGRDRSLNQASLCILKRREKTCGRRLLRFFIPIGCWKTLILNYPRKGTLTDSYIFFGVVIKEKHKACALSTGQ